MRCCEGVKCHIIFSSTSSFCQHIYKRSNIAPEYPGDWHVFLKKLNNNSNNGRKAARKISIYQAKALIWKLCVELNIHLALFFKENAFLQLIFLEKLSTSSRVCCREMLFHLTTPTVPINVHTWSFRTPSEFYNNLHFVWRWSGHSEKGQSKYTFSFFRERNDREGACGVCKFSLTEV